MEQQINETTNKTIDYIINHPFTQFFIKLAIAIVVFFILIIISKILARIIRRKIINNITLADDEYIGKIGKLLEDIIFYMLALFSLFFSAKIVGVDLGLFVGGLSVGIGFAFKEFLGNMIAGIVILTTKDYKLGDIIEIKIGADEYLGRIEEITIRYTVLRLLDKRRIIIPNGQLLNSIVTTLTSEDLIRVESNFIVHYDVNIDDAISIIKNTLEKIDILQNKKDNKVLITELGERGVNLKVWYYYSPQSGYLPISVMSIVNKAIYDAFKENGLPVPYVHHIITFDKNDKNLLSTVYNVFNIFKKG